VVPLAALRTPQPVRTIRLDATPASWVGPGINSSYAFGSYATIPDSPLVGAIGSAFWAYWQVLTTGEATLDGSRYPAAMVGEELARANEELAQLKADGRGRRYTVDEAKLLLFYQEADVAGCYFEFVGWQDRITPQTPISTPPWPPLTNGETIESIYTLVHSGDGWKVARSESRR
jgi:hypothetical protein